MILITGATGTVGQELVQQLVEASYPVRVFTRDERKVAHYVDVPESVEAQNMLKAGLPQYAVHGLVEAFTAMRGGRFAYLTNAVEQVTGRPACSFEVWCREHIAAFK
jgi:nucleoside-diphosphate-sugar epimerase